MKIARYRWTPLTIIAVVLAVAASGIVLADMFGVGSAQPGFVDATILRYCLYVIYGGVALMTVRLVGGHFGLAWFFAVALATLDAAHQLYTVHQPETLHYWLANLIAITLFLAIAFFIEPRVLRRLARRRIRLQRSRIRYV